MKDWREETQVTTERLGTPESYEGLESARYLLESTGVSSARTEWESLALSCAERHIAGLFLQLLAENHVRLRKAQKPLGLDAAVWEKSAEVLFCEQVNLVAKLLCSRSIRLRYPAVHRKIPMHKRSKAGFW